MSHFSVLVIGDDIDKQLAPYDENKDGTENAKWDWWMMGGRWGGYFTLKPGKHGRLGQPSTFDRIEGDSRDHSKVDQARKGDIDFEAMRQEKADKAAARFDQVARLFGGTIPALDYTWDEVLNGERFKVLTIDEKRVLYHNQPAMKTIERVSRDGTDLSEDDKKFLIWLADEIETYQCSREDYLARASAGAVIPFALVKDSIWYEKGEMGWWGMVSNEKKPDEWAAQFRALFDSLPDDALLTMVDCHI